MGRVPALDGLPGVVVGGPDAARRVRQGGGVGELRQRFPGGTKRQYAERGHPSRRQEGDSGQIVRLVRHYFESGRISIFFVWPD
jgi:hypothetical protein